MEKFFEVEAALFLTVYLVPLILGSIIFSVIFCIIFRLIVGIRRVNLGLPPNNGSQSSSNNSQIPPYGSPEWEAGKKASEEARQEWIHRKSS
jgi:hypothetical protein